MSRTSLCITKMYDVGLTDFFYSFKIIIRLNSDVDNQTVEYRTVCLHQSVFDIRNVIIIDKSGIRDRRHNFIW